MLLSVNEVKMRIVNNKNIKPTQTSTQVFKKVCVYCLPHMSALTLAPFSVVLLSLLISVMGGFSVAEFLTTYVAFPLAVAAPLFITVKIIYALKGAFPRKTNDSHKVVLSVFFCSSLCIVVLELLFNLSCAMYSAYPLRFMGAAYMRDMFASSPSAMILFYVTLFFLYTVISLMSVTAFFIGDSTKKRFSFTLSCMIFIGMYVILLLLFILAYFAATFLDIIALESIQISGSIFNSSMLCSFITFILLSIIVIPLLYIINMSYLKKIKADKTK